MRRVTQVVALTFLMLIPATGASADECPTISGKAFFDFGRSGTGMANVVYGGERMLVPFRAISYDGFDILFEWDFPQGQVLIVEHSTFEPFAGPIGAFNSELDVQGPLRGSLDLVGYG